MEIGVSDLVIEEIGVAARDLVRSLPVSRVLAAGGGAVVRPVVELGEFGESEPLLLAAAAIERSWLDIAKSALNRAESELAQARNAEATDLLSVPLLRMALSCQRGDAVGGLAAASRLQELMEVLKPVEPVQAPELPPLIDYYVAGCEWSMGRLTTARSILQIGAGSLERSDSDPDTIPEQLVRANCAGRLAWLDAFCGNLRRSMRYATAVLTSRRADSDEKGVRFAHLATVLVHLERGEVEQAKQRLDHAVSRSADEGDPLLVAAQQLTQVRLAMVTNGPNAALKQLQHDRSTGRKISTGWFAEQFTLAEADAYLVGGEAREAIAILTRAPHLASAEATFLIARAHRAAGDIAAADAALDQMPWTASGDALATEVRRWLLLAQLHVERNDIQVAELLVDRALRAAASEELRETVRQADGWLRSFVARDAHLLLRHSVFLGSLGYETAPRALRQREKTEPPDALIVVPLTARETDVLNLLAEYCSNEEIAADLVVSMNTVKTHIRSLFQKLSVTRRADAVRRGRALGLC
jgi:LuxR family maltose regulon positive regulatory protein